MPVQGDQIVNVPASSINMTGIPAGVLASANQPNVAILGLGTGLSSDGTNLNCTVPGNVQADWNATSGASQILNKPSLATVATSGSYNDLSSKPSIPSAQVNSDWNATSGLAQILNKPTIPTNTNQLTNGAGYVTSAGASSASPVQSVNGLTGAVALSIPAAQVNSDWNAASGLAQILNKPTIPTTTSQLTNNSSFITAAGAPVQSVNGQTGAVVLSIPSAVTRVFAYPTRSLVTTTASTGYQISSTRDAYAVYSVTITTTSTITSGAQGTAYLEVCPTNSTTPSAWQIADSATSGQTYSLAVAIQGVQPISLKLDTIVPAGYYARLRTAINTGTTSTCTFAYASGCEVLL